MGKVLQSREEKEQAWINKINSLVNTIFDWCEGTKWALTKESKTVTENIYQRKKFLHPWSYEVPVLTFMNGDNQITLEPIALYTIYDVGKVDLYAFPTFRRIHLLPDKNDQENWNAITDTGIPLRMPWDKKHFLQLLSDLTDPR